MVTPGAYATKLDRKASKAKRRNDESDTCKRAGKPARLHWFSAHRPVTQTWLRTRTAQRWALLVQGRGRLFYWLRVRGGYSLEGEHVTKGAFGGTLRATFRAAGA